MTDTLTSANIAGKDPDIAVYALCLLIEMDKTDDTEIWAISATSLCWSFAMSPERQEVMLDMLANRYTVDRVATPPMVTK